MKRERSRGAVMVEFVFVFPVMLLLFFGVLQMAVVHAARHIVHYAAVRAARAAIVHEPGARQAYAQLAAEKVCRTLAGYEQEHVLATILKGNQEKLDDLEEIIVRVDYQLWLGMPFAGRAAAIALRATDAGRNAPPGNYMTIDQVSRMRATLREP